MDMLIAAFALRLGNCTVVTADSDPAAVAGLTVENWAS
jgi:tRNA(fMet)-specific endonuclease VapC